MKAVYSSLITLLFFSACGPYTKEGTKDFIPGMYVRAIDHEFAKGMDTLVIKRMEGNTYEISKRSGFNRIRNGKVLPYERHQEKWTGIYDEEDRVVRERRKGKLISFVPKENKLLVGTSAYKKVKP